MDDARLIALLRDMTDQLHVARTETQALKSICGLLLGEVLRLSPEPEHRLAFVKQMVEVGIAELSQTTANEKVMQAAHSLSASVLTIGSVHLESPVLPPEGG